MLQLSQAITVKWSSLSFFVASFFFGASRP